MIHNAPATNPRAELWPCAILLNLGPTPMKQSLSGTLPDRCSCREGLQGAVALHVTLGHSPGQEDNLLQESLCRLLCSNIFTLVI